jgi:methionyl aminopeptidase
MISIKTAAEQEKIADTCRITARCMELLGSMVRPGVATEELDRAAESFIRKHGGSPTFKGYRGFPASICTSVNEEVVHGIPSARKLAEGDIVGIDMGILLDGFTSDMARTFLVGKVSQEAAALVETTKECFFRGFGQVKPGARVGDIGWAVQALAESRGYSVVRELCGHGVGRELWEEPEIPNFGKPGRGVRLEAGMTICIEPMINLGVWQVEQDKADGWTIRTADRKLSAHYEETVLVTEAGAKILTVP